MLGRLLVALFLSISLSGVVVANDAGVAPFDAQCANAIPAEFQSFLGSEGVTLSLDGKETAHVWLAKDLPKAESPNSELGVSFGQLEEGGLVGVIHLLSEWHDYKENVIAPGVYALRYWIMPQDGNHMGVATYRDFLLLTDISVDTDPTQTLKMASLYKASMKATDVPHPGVLAMYPIWDQVSEPTIVENDLGQPTLAYPKGDLTLGLIVKGHGES